MQMAVSQFFQLSLREIILSDKGVQFRRSPLHSTPRIIIIIIIMF